MRVPSSGDAPKGGGDGVGEGLGEGEGLGLAVGSGNGDPDPPEESTSASTRTTITATALNATIASRTRGLEKLLVITPIGCSNVNPTLRLTARRKPSQHEPYLS